jgi:alpha-ribazole phosphatase
VSDRVVHLMRHGPPVRTGLMLGHTDEPALTADCPAIRSRVAPLAISKVVSSDLRRAAEQAGTIAQDRQLSFATDPAWRELDFGHWDGLPAATIERAALAQFWGDPDAAPPPSGERWSELCARVAVALEATQDRSLVVTHGGSMRAAIAVLTGLDHRGVWALDLPYRALLTLRIWPGAPLSGQIVGLVTGEAG